MSRRWRRRAQFGAGLLGPGLLGQGVAAGNRHIGPPYYLVNDTFTTDRAAGAVNGTDAEPGPGRRGVVDSGTYVTLSSGALAISAGGSTWGTSALYYTIPQRTPGRMMIARVNFANKLFAVVGWSNNSTGLGSSTHCVQFYFRDVLRWWGGDIAYNHGAYNTATDYDVVAILRAAGGFLFMKISGNWILLEIMRTGTAVCNPQINSFNASLTAPGFRVPSALWLPTPLVSDGFSGATSDGLGHAEGIAGGLGSGGHGKAWTANVGTWGAAGGVAAATALSGGRAIATVDAGKADLVIAADMTISASTMSIVVRWASESNFIQIRRTATNLQLVKTIAGVDTIVLDSASTYVAGARVVLICEGTKFRMFYNNAAVGAEQTISDAAVQSPTIVGLRTGGTGNTADNFVAYARGSGGEYSALDAY